MTAQRDAGFFTEALSTRDPELFGSIRNELGREFACAEAIDLVVLASDPAAVAALPLWMNENKPDAPVKSRFQISWPGHSGSAGWKTSATSGCVCNHRAIWSADAACAFMRTDKVRRPRLAR